MTRAGNLCVFVCVYEGGGWERWRHGIYVPVIFNLMYMYKYDIYRDRESHITLAICSIDYKYSLMAPLTSWVLSLPFWLQIPIASLT